MKKKLKILIIAFLFITSMTFYSKSMASNNCKPIDENNIKYVNATFAKINREEYNASQRGISTDEYYSLSKEERYNIDSKSMLMASTEGKCSGGIQNGYLSVDQYGGSDGVIQGLAENRLVNGNLNIVNKFTNGTSFFPKSNTNSKIYDEVLSNWKFPFIKENNGYYSFNSDKFHVYKDYNTKTFKMHEGERSGFYPFNDCNDDTSILENRNLGFTGRIEIPFIMTRDGKVKNTQTNEYEDMVFNFSGDDDVWVFVDDKLVLDLGGCHIKIQGNINFAKNEVYYESVYDKSTNSMKKDVIEKAFDNKLEQGQHTLTLFYMERAGGESNLFVTFNLQSNGVQANYIDINTNEKLDTESKSGPIGEKVTTEAKQIEGYTLVKKPDVEEFILSENLQVVNYYYSKNTNIKAKYVDEVTNKEIAQSETIKGIYGDKYTTNKKEIENYDFTKVEGEPSGTMKGEDKTIIYYYRHKSKITVNYIDEETGEKIDIVNKNVHEGDEFSAEERQYEDYKLTKKPDSQTVTVKKEDITLNYYYKRLRFNLQIEMNLEKAYVNGNYYGLNGKIGKIETEIRDANANSTLQIHYKIKVTNNEERIGSGYISFTIPEGFSVLNEDWEINENIAKYKVPDLNIGETREYEIIIKKNEGVDIAQNVKAYVRIDSEKLEETTLEDNEDMNELGIMPRTGVPSINVVPIILILSAIAVLVFIKLKKNNNRKEK